MRSKQPPSLSHRHSRQRSCQPVEFNGTQRVYNSQICIKPPPPASTRPMPISAAKSTVPFSTRRGGPGNMGSATQHANIFHFKVYTALSDHSAIQQNSI